MALEGKDGAASGADLAATRFVLTRHGESTWNATGRWQGHGDPPLTARGVAQAEALAQSLRASLAGQPVAALVSSDLRRARETAAAIARALSLELQLDARLRELDVGSWTGLTREEIALRDGPLLARFESLAIDVRPGGGESRAEIRRRVRPAALEWARRAPGQCIVVVAHLGVLRALVPGLEAENASAHSHSLGEMQSAQRAT